MLFVREADALSTFKYFYYEPSMAAAVIFIILFLLTSTLHGYQMFRTRTWFMIPFFIGSIFDTIGYVGRAFCANQNPGPYTLGPYIIQSLFLLVAPALFAASIYMELGRIVHMVEGEHKLFIRRTWLTKIFVCGDIFTFFLQSSGAGLLASHSNSMINTGKTIVIAGLGLQVVIFGLFVLASIIFHVRVAKAPTRKCQETPWHKHMFSLYVVSILIFVRSLIRVIEYVEGYDGYIMTHEVFLYIFDATLMWLATVTMSWVHPSEVKAHLRGGKAFIGPYNPLAMEMVASQVSTNSPKADGYSSRV